MKKTRTLLTVCLSVLLLLVLVLPLSAAVALPYQSKMASNMPTDTFDNDGKLNVTFHGNWDAVTYPANNYTPEARKILNSVINTANANDYFWGVEGSSHGWYTEVRARQGSATWGGTSSLNTPATYIGGWRYTAEYSGLATLSFGAIRQIASASPVYVAAFVNGKMVWPTMGGTVYDAEAENPYAAWQVIGSTVSVAGSFNGDAKLADHYLTAGDEVEFFIAGNGSCNQNKAVVQPIVTYTEWVDAPALGSTTVALGEAFAANFSVSAHAKATNLGAYINGEFVPAADGCVRVGGIAAKNLVDKIEVIPACTLGGAELRGEAVNVSVADLLQRYVTDGEQTAEVKALAAATLNYAAAAQIYFDYEIGTLANAGLPESNYTGAYTSVMTGFDGEKEDNVATPYAATLLLRDTLAFKFIYTEACDGFAEKYRIALLDENGNAVKTVAPVLCEEQTDTYKAIFDGIMPTAWNATYTVAVIAADDVAEKPTVIGETFGYSVMSYLVRASVKDSKVAEVAPAMYALYEAAVAYAAAQN